MEDLNTEELIAIGQRVLSDEAEAISDLKERVNSDFVKACQLMFQCSGRVVVTGMGKSGHIGGKLAATLASTGTPSFFVHPGEANHGDLGMIVDRDVVLALSNSGETGEVLTILPVIKRMAVPLIAMTGRPESTLARAADVHIDISVAREACPLDLAPTSSTTATLAMGDALAIALLESRKFTENDFALSHPGGSLGRRLLLRISDIMHTAHRIPKVETGSSLREALVEMTAKGLGLTTIMDGDDFAGIFTDGDLRRALDGPVNVHEVLIEDVMTKGGTTATPDMLASEALHLMETQKINALPVLNEEGQLVGVFNMHDLLRAGVV